ncbi:MAG: hypothetical protein LH469_05400 [Frankiaceae bacterium]|nr:hypothetical protein [Frankiaceae bacterium]
MARTAQNGHDAHVVRVLTLLAVLLGLLAMHGVASTHHAPAAAAEPSAAAQPYDPPEAGPHHQAATAAAQQPSPLPAGPATPPCDQDCPGALAALCVAVLAVAAELAVAVVLRPHRGVVAAPTVCSADAPASARAALPPPDPVRELCISRT